MRTTAILLATIAAPTVLAHVAVAPRQEATQAVPAPTAPAPPSAPTHDDDMDHGTMNHPPTPTPTRPSAYEDLAKCELAIDTLLKAFGMVPTPNAALSSFLATETVKVANPCQWASDVPDGLQGAYSAYSRDFVEVLSEHGDLVTQLESCVDAGGASVTRAEIVTPLFELPGCEAVSTTDGGAQSTAAPNAQTSTTTRGFPTGSSTAGVPRATGVALAGVAAAALLGVAGVL